eukprot:scaffold77332_cov60-Phaeocystis_antarctica.AAC.1
MPAVTGCDGACCRGFAARARGRRRTADGGGRLRRLRCARGAGSHAARAAPAGRRRVGRWGACAARCA